MIGRSPWPWSGQENLNHVKYCTEGISVTDSASLVSEHLKSENGHFGHLELISSRKHPSLSHRKEEVGTSDPDEEKGKGRGQDSKVKGWRTESE